jgi:prepilin peptidase CpaA
MAFAASSDLLTMRISNKVSLGLVGGFFVLALAIGMPWATIGMHAAAGALMLVLTLICFQRGWIGGGDAKLAAATALWFGFDQLGNYLLCASVLGGVLTLMILRFRHMPLPAAFARHPWLARLHRADVGVPYGIALAAAALIIYPHTTWMQAAGF